MIWRKLGLVYAPSALHPKLKSHAANPLAMHLEGNLFRVFFSGRDADNRSSVGYADLDMASRKVVGECTAPVFEHGPAGSFYSHGVSIGNSYEAGGKTYILFMGWQVPAGGHWRGDIGRLTVDASMKLQLDSNKPFMGADATDPVSLSYPWVMRNADGSYRMWYGSTLNWKAANGEMVHVIHGATSADGNLWQRNGLAVPYAEGVAQAFSRPAVIGSAQSGYHMWFSYRDGNGTAYRIGYAASVDGVSWDLRLEEAGIDVSQSGWDSEMIEYPFVFSHQGEHFMLYNGNAYGRTGFGMAVLEDR